MLEIQTVEKKGIELIDSRILHKALEVRSYHADWIRRRIENYQFEEGLDYYICLSKKSSKKGSGGSNRKDYLITKDMAKELAMLENNDIGKNVRKYFIQKEKEANQHIEVRAITKHVRKKLTAVIDSKDLNSKMHGFGYSNFTKLVYSLTGLSVKKKEFGKKEGFRQTLSTFELENVERVESMIKALIELDKEYSDIRDTMKPLFEKKEIG